MKTIINIKNLTVEYEYMQAVLVKNNGYIRKDKKTLFATLYSAISTAIYNTKELSNTKAHHIEYLTNFSYQYFINKDISIENIKQLHTNILPPDFKSNFIYDDVRAKQTQKIQRGEFREMDTYMKFDNKEIDFEKSQNIESKLSTLIHNFNKSNQKVFEIVYFLLESFRIHPFEDGNGKVFRVLFDVLLIKQNYYPSLFNKIYQENNHDFRMAIGHFVKQSKEEGLEKFLSLLLRPVYKEVYFR